MTPKARSFPLMVALLAALAAAPAAGCGGDDDGSSTSNNPTGGGGSGGTGAGGGGGGTPALGDHLLITELMVSPDPGEFVEIWNPTSAEVDLSDHYISDNGAYFRIANGEAWLPSGTPGTDFLAQFPAGTRLAAGASLVLAANPGFEAEHMRCADFALTTAAVTCSTGSTPPMLAPQNGGLGDQSSLLTNDGEMVILFQWSGVVGEPVKDVDYVVWGTTAAGASEYVDKTGQTGYQPDTATADQLRAPTPPTGQSIERCMIEPGELTADGNGLTGHDETSEQLDQSFVLQTTPSAGLPNICLMGI